MYGLWGYLLKAKGLVPINTRRVLERKQHVVYVLISPPPPPRLPIHNKTFSDQHGRCVQKYDHPEARFITVTYYIKAFSLSAIDFFCFEY